MICPTGGLLHEEQEEQGRTGGSKSVFKSEPEEYHKNADSRIERPDVVKTVYYNLMIDHVSKSPLTCRQAMLHHLPVHHSK
jgi:hypothetical protein